MAAGTKKRNPVGNLPDNKNFDKDKMREEVENYPENVVVNWSDLARKRNIRNTQSEVALKNGGQIAKEFMKSVGVDVNSFKRKHLGNDERVRRKKLRGQGGEITVAVPQTIESVKAEMKKILSGEYIVGQQIVPRKVCVIILHISSAILNSKRLNSRGLTRRFATPTYTVYSMSIAQ
jgi:hypothetical protein